MAEFVWNLCGPMYRPPTYDANNLGLDYTDGADARWPKPGLVLGPSRTTLDCGSAGGTAANVNGGAMIQRTTGGSDWFLYLLRGTRPTKVIVPSGNTALSLAATQPSSSGTGDLATRGMSICVTQNTGGNPMLSIGQVTGSYHNFTTIAAQNAADTASANNESKAYPIVAYKEGMDRMAGLDARNVSGNILTASVSADASSWQTLATHMGAFVSPTGFAMSQNLWLIGTQTGVLVLNAQLKEFFPAFSSVPASADNCRAMYFAQWLGVLVPLQNQIRLMNGEYSNRVGPEAYGTPNTVQGAATGIGGNADFVFIAIRNPATSKTYILAARPREQGAWHGNQLSYYCIDSFSSVSEWVQVLRDPSGIRTNQVLAVGDVDDLSYYRIGRTANWTDDVSSTDYYLYAASTTQTAYGNAMRFERPMKVQRVIWEGSGLSSSKTLTMSLGYEGFRGQSGTHAVNVQNTSGLENVAFTPNRALENVTAFWPQVSLVSNVTSASPCLVQGRVKVIAEPMS